MADTDTEWEIRIQALAAALPFPSTPDIAGAVRQKAAASPGRVWAPRLVWAILLLLLAAGLLAAPQVRAAVLRVLQIGAVTIFEAESAGTAVPPTTEQPATTLPAIIPTATVPAWPTLSLTGIATEMTLAEAQTAVPFPLAWPAYPEDLGEPDHIYVQDPAWPRALILAWQEPGDPAQRRLVLYAIRGQDYAFKQAEMMQSVLVNGREAAWVSGPHVLYLQDGQAQTGQFIGGNVLLWSTPLGITYRLEGAESLAEAIRIAESLGEP